MTNSSNKLRLTLAILLLVQPGAHATKKLSGEPWIMPFDVNERYRPADPATLSSGDIKQQDIYEFAWKTFIALNWPYKEGGQRGEPDREGQLAGIINTDAPNKMVVWETYMSPQTVFVSPQSWPVEWGQPDFVGLQRIATPPCYSDRYAYGRPFAPGINQPYTNANVPTGPVVDQNKNYLRVEVTLSQPYFEYISKFHYYDADVQASAVANFVEFANKYNAAPDDPDDDSYFQPLPTGTEAYIAPLEAYAQQGITEIKAAWKVLKTVGEDADVPGRYFRRILQFPLPDGSLSEPTLVGLVGLHIHRVTPFGHLPSTFEHVDNVSLHRTGADPLPLPAHPALNPGNGRGKPESYPNGYEVNGKSGEAGLIPAPYKEQDSLIPVEERETVNVSRVTPIPRHVEKVNQKYREMLKDSVWSYYQLIGTQNKNIDTPNDHLGPGIPGPQQSNVQNLVNTTLETYTQKGFSCAGCHLNAFPHGVSSFPPYEKRFEDLHVMSFLLLNAISGSQPVGSQGCSTPAL